MTLHGAGGRTEVGLIGLVWSREGKAEGIYGNSFQISREEENCLLIKTKDRTKMGLNCNGGNLATILGKLSQRQ